MRLLPFPARPGDEEHRVATPLELYFDLVCVIAIAAATAAFHHEISHGHATEALLPYFLAVTSVWWVWANFTWFASSFDNDDTLYRLLVFVMIGGFAVYAGGIGYIFDSQDARLGVLGWIIMRAALVLQWLRAGLANPDHRATALVYAVGLTIVQALWFVFFVVIDLGETGYRAAAVGLMALELAVPLLASRFGHPDLHRHHMVERHGLLHIIVLGEIVLSATLFFGELHDSDHASVDVALGGAVTIALACMMWVYYFIPRDHLKAIHEGSHFGLWGYLHILVYFFAAMFGAVSAAQFDLITHHSEADAATLAVLTNATLAAYVLGLWIIRDRYVEDRYVYWVSLLGPLPLLVAAVVAPPYWATALIFFGLVTLRRWHRNQAEVGH